jgi:hypothetical protein
MSAACRKKELLTFVAAWRVEARPWTSSSTRIGAWGVAFGLYSDLTRVVGSKNPLMWSKAKHS